jgi:hypothetical protein
MIESEAAFLLAGLSRPAAWLNCQQEAFNAISHYTTVCTAMPSAQRVFPNSSLLTRIAGCITTFLEKVA